MPMTHHTPTHEIELLASLDLSADNTAEIQRDVLFVGRLSGSFGQKVRHRTGEKLGSARSGKMAGLAWAGLGVRFVLANSQ